MTSFDDFVQEQLADPEFARAYARAKRPRAFFFHFNKPASIKAGKVQVSVHWDGACHIVDNVVCNVPTQGRIRKTQPRFVMVGKARYMIVSNGVAYLG